MVSASAWMYFLAALLILTVPLDYLAAAVIAAAVHEGCHFAAIMLLGGNVSALQLRPWGAVMDAQIQGKGRELLCAAAGPAGSLSLLCLCHKFPQIALCGCVQGVYNLLPIYPMDGGRILECLLTILAPKHAKIWLNAAEVMTCVLILLLAAAGTFVFSAGCFPVILALFLLLRVIRRKIPCKRRQIGVQ